MLMLQHTTLLNKIPHNFVIFSAFFLKVILLYFLGIKVLNIYCSFP